MTVASTPLPKASTDPDVVENALLGRKVRLLQRAHGYRAGMDAALLAAAVPAKPGQRVLEAGCGAGAVLMQIGQRCPGARLTGLERDPIDADLAVRNATLNAMENRVEIITGDVASGLPATDRASFDWAISNPPFFDDARALRAPAPAKRGAWIADDGLAVWTDFLMRAVRDGGGVVVVHRADRLADLLDLLGKRCGSFAVRPVQPFADQPAKRVLVHARKAGRAPLRLLPPLVLHDRSGSQHAPEAEAILRGEADLPW